jgi:hypothetical protein
MGIFDDISISRITTSAAKDSLGFYYLGFYIKNPNEEMGLELEEMIGISGVFLNFHDSFKLFFNDGQKKCKTEAIEFLTWFAAYSFSIDEKKWESEHIRHLAQGLYTSMTDSPAHFLHYNTPLIEQAIVSVNNFLDGIDPKIIDEYLKTHP